MPDFAHGWKGGNIQNGQIISPMVSNWKVWLKSELLSRRVRHCSVSVPLHIFFYPLLTEKVQIKNIKSLTITFLLLFPFFLPWRRCIFCSLGISLESWYFLEFFPSTLKKTHRCSFLGKLIEAFQSFIRWWPDFLSA